MQLFWSLVGLDKLSFCLLTILKKLTSLHGYPLLQFKDISLILKRQFICSCIVALHAESEI